jgi:hypothetical protein
MKKCFERVLLDIKLKKALELPISKRVIIAAKLASRNENKPYCSGPNPLAKIIPVRNIITDLTVFSRTEMTNLFPKFIDILFRLITGHGKKIIKNCIFFYKNTIKHTHIAFSYINKYIFA